MPRYTLAVVLSLVALMPARSLAQQVPPETSQGSRHST